MLTKGVVSVARIWVNITSVEDHAFRSNWWMCCFVVVSPVQFFVWEACQDTTLIILMVAAALSLGTGMWVHVSWSLHTS